MNERVKTTLQTLSGDRVSFDRNERVVYSRDVASLPDAVEIMIDNLADAVVQPESLEDLIFLAQLANREGVPVVPRGAATSGYGGSVPAKAGIVVALRQVPDHDGHLEKVRRSGLLGRPLLHRRGRRGLRTRAVGQAPSSQG